MMKASFLRILFVAVLCMSNSWGQSQQWESMYSYYNVSIATTYNQTVIAAAENALFLYDPIQNNSETITTVDGLSGDNFSAITVHNGKIIAGFENGLVAKIDSNTKKVDIDNAIERNTTIAADEKQINQILIDQNVAYLATGFGIVELNPTTLEFGDTYYFSASGARIRVNQVAIFEAYLYAATQQGVYRTLLNNPNKLEFSSWELHASGNWISLWMQDNKLYGAKDEGSAVSFFQLHDNIAQKVRFSGKARHIAPHKEGVILTLTGVYSLNKSFEVVEAITTIDDVNRNTFQFGLVANDEVYVGTSSVGLIRYTAIGDDKYVSPKGPLQNSVFDIESLANEFWISHGDYDLFYNPYPLEKYGISHFTQSGWENISSESLFSAESVVRVVPHPTEIGTLYACSYHGGIVALEDNIPTVLWNQTNSGLESLTFDGDNISIRVRDAIVDDSGNLWSLTGFVQNGLKKRSPSGQWTSYDLSEVVSDYTREAGYSNMELYEDKIIFFGGLKSALIGVDISQSPPQMKRLMGGEFGVPSDDIRSVRLDKDNRLWVGTREGIAVLYAPNRFFEDETQLRSIVVEDGGNLRELLSGQLITDIEVDGNNQKWVSTATSGVFLLSPNGTEILQHFTKENSPLPTSSVKSIGIDSATGKVYLGTLNGMVVFQGDAYAESDKLSEINVFPNPVRPNFTGNLVIRGLQQDSRVKITDIAGNLVYDTTSEGGSISWNLRSFSGQRVRSGVYLIFASSKDGLDNAVKKVMIVN
ncbi:MAG: T9SS type A sorting domain-containing protein [Bacteroidetes bacterium]|nr:T9SS type A sorting domain-containing protein [Bacteroidota bacterium]